MSITGRRLSPAASREAALAAARALLVEQGPQAVTLKAVATRIGRTHANLLHHFGSAAGLQTALAASMAETITAGIADAVLAARRGEIPPRAVIDLVFDAYGKEGGAALASWAILNGNRDVLALVLAATHRLVDQLGEVGGRPGPAISLMLALTAIGDALMGEGMAAELGLPRDTARFLATTQLLTLLGPGAGPVAGVAPGADSG
jgi:AcrR family transcriptional regulator